MERWTSRVEVVTLKEDNKATSQGTILLKATIAVPPAEALQSGSTPRSSTGGGSGSFPSAGQRSPDGGSGGSAFHQPTTRTIMALWNPVTRRFETLNTPPLPTGTSSSSSNSELGSPMSPLSWLPPDLSKQYPVQSSLTACCVYGVIETGLSHVLVVVTGTEEVPGLELPGGRGHKVHRVGSVKVVSLPCARAGTSPFQGKSPAMVPADGESSKEPSGVPAATKDGKSAGNTKEVDGREAAKKAKLYVDLIKRFFSGGPDKINMYLSYTLDLTLPLEKSLPNTAPSHLPGSGSFSGLFGTTPGGSFSPSKLKSIESVASVDQWGFAKDSEVSGPAASPHLVVDPNSLPSRNDFRWNAHLISQFSIDLHVMVPPIIRGFVGSATCMNHFGTTPTIPHPEVHVALIGRQSALNAGTRYNRRGINGEGVPGNFTETEQVVWTTSAPSGELHGVIDCYRMVRGSVPVQWQQVPDFSLKPRPAIKSSQPVEQVKKAQATRTPNSSFATARRSSTEDATTSASKPSGVQHHHDLEALGAQLGCHIKYVGQAYPEMDRVYCVDLMDTNHPKEGPLSEAFKQAVQQCMCPGKDGAEDVKDDQGDDKPNLNTSAAGPGNTTLNTSNVFASQWTYIGFNLGKALHRCAKAKTKIWDTIRQELPKDDACYRSTILEVVKPGGQQTLKTPTSVGTPNRASRASPSSTQSQGIASTGTKQQTLMRINCLDCLDRTGITQFALGSEVLRRQVSDQVHKAQQQAPSPLHDLGSKDSLASGAVSPMVRSQDSLDLAMMKGYIVDALSSEYRDMWKAHSNAVSLNYAGSNALLRDVLETGMRTMKGKGGDATRAIKRYFQQHGFDGAKQDSVLLVTGKHDANMIEGSNPLGRKMSWLNTVVLGGAVVGWLGLFLSAFVTFKYTSSPRWWMACLMMNLWLVHVVVVSVVLRRDSRSYIDKPMLACLEPVDVATVEE